MEKSNPILIYHYPLRRLQNVASFQSYLVMLLTMTSFYLIILIGFIVLIWWAFSSTIDDFILSIGVIVLVLQFGILWLWLVSFPYIYIYIFNEALFTTPVTSAVVIWCYFSCLFELFIFWNLISKLEMDCFGF